VRIRIAVPEQFVEPGVIDAALESVTRLNEHMIRSGQVPTSHQLIEQGAVWRPEDPGDEHFDHGGTIQKRGWGDCDDWAPLHAATLRASGEDPGAIARVIPSGPSTYHAIVQRSDGQLDDPSIAAGMKAQRVGGISDDETIAIQAIDPHDGRVYQGQLAPAVGPLSVHCGPSWGVRRSHVVGYGDLYEGRVDLPLNGSPLVQVRQNIRHHHTHHHHRSRKHRVHGMTTVVGAVPYALSVTARHPSPYYALGQAICGAIVIGDAADMSTSLDRYKLLAVQSAMTGMSPGQVHDALVTALTDDLHAAAAQSGRHPAEHSADLLAQLAQEGIHAGTIAVGDLFGDIGKIASGVVSTVSHVVNQVASVVKSPVWGDILHDVQAAVSVVPGLGTAVSDIVAAAETAYESAAALLSGNPFEAAIHAAYNFALASIPGAAVLHSVLDPIVNSLLQLTTTHEPIESAALDALLSAVPDAPKVGAVSPRSIASSLAQMVVKHLGVKRSAPGTALPDHVKSAVAAARKNGPALAKTPAAKALPLHLAHAAPIVHKAPAKAPAPIAMHAVALHAPAPAVAPALAAAQAVVKPLGVPHAAVHVDTVPAPAPGSPGAPPGASSWVCSPQPSGTYDCQWR